MRKETENEDIEKKSEIPPAGFFALFKYASVCDRVLIISATVLALVSGASLPAINIVIGNVINQLVDYDKSRNFPNSTNFTHITDDEFLSTTANLCIYIAIIGCSTLLCNYIMVSFFSIAGANQSFKIRCLFMSSVLKQDIGWYDTNETGDFASQITGDLTRIQDGIGEKVGICISFLSSTVLCVGSALYYGWKLALVILAASPVLTIALSMVTKIQASAASEEMRAYGKAGVVAEEVLSSIRTVFAFGGERKEIQRYGDCLSPAKKKAIKRGLMTAIGQSITWFCTFSGYALAYWYGVRLIIESMGEVNPEYNGGVFLIVYYNITVASMYTGYTAPYFEAFALAKGSAAKIFSIIDRVPVIDSSSNDGKKPETLTGKIGLRSVQFSYPARPTVPVLKGVSLDVQPGETVALVGPSGCGKSTIIQLILRFYDTGTGSVFVDDNDVRDLNVGWLRHHIGLVGQEPVLFSTTIAENIRYGKRDATDEEIENAAKLANVHDFIESLPLKYRTLVGERGTQLSGGQKQRIAIARALVKNPRILLLDEATSALDTESEAVVQAALDKASQGRTTIVVAHRLSTIRSADKIIVLSDGEIKETGNHEELMEAMGIYYQLVLTQTKTEEKKEEIEDDEYVQVSERQIVYNMSSRSYGSGDCLMGSIQSQPGSAVRQISAKDAYERQNSKTAATEKNTPVDANEEEGEEVPSPSQLRLWKMSVPEWPYALVGAVSAVLMGLHFPLFGIIFGDVMGVLSKPVDDIKQQVPFFCLIFFLMGITSALFGFLQVFMFSIAGERLTSRLRKMVFANIITQDIEFFDHPKNSVGALCSRLTSDASGVQGATGSRMSTLLQAFSTLVACIVIAFIYNYKIGLVVLSFIPLVLLGAYFESKVISGGALTESKGTEAASKIAIEAIEGIRTVASLHQEKTFFSQFYNELLTPHRKSRLSSQVRGIIYGYSQGIIQGFMYAAAIFYGSRLVVQDKTFTYSQLLKIIEGIFFGVTTIGQAVAFTPDYQKAKLSAVRIFRLLDLKPTINVFSTEGEVLSNVKGHILFQKVHFNYPSRPDVRVLRGLSLEIDSGKTTALVGSSGCGKSTCVQLIERFYDTQHGATFVDGHDVKDLNVSNLRSHVGLVSQEPILFSYSIGENIAYGDNSRQVDMAEIIEAARQANIHNFIASLPQGYATPVGERGAQLSGGQKQRVAIARALLRNPRILLLDEATSALDAESEKVVQEALDRARSGRTCLVIAHRLTTVQSADVIVVIHKGKIVEKGTHQELLNKRGHYYNLHNTQTS